MRFRRIASAIAAILVGAATLATFQPAGPADAAVVTSLPITSVYQVLADTAHGHVFISQGPDGDGGAIEVTNLSGTPVAAIGKGAYGLALSADDTTLYAAIGDTVTAFSTTTLKQTASYSTPGQAFSVALQSGRLWVSYETASDSTESTISGINLADPTAAWDSTPWDWLEPPAIAADPSDHGILIASGDPITEPSTTVAYDVSVPAAITQIDSSTSIFCGSTNLSVLPGGGTFVCEGSAYSTTTMASASDAEYGAVSVVAPNGAIAGEGLSDVVAYSAGATTPTDDYEQFYGLSLPPGYEESSSDPVGIAWSANGQQLFTVMVSTIDGIDPVYTMLVLSPFGRVPAQFTWTSTATTVPYGGTANITAQLGFTYGPPEFSVYATAVGQPRQLLWSGEIGPGNTITFPGSTFTRNTTMSAVYAGDTRYLPTTASLAIKVGVKIADSLSGYYKTTTVAGLQYRLYHHDATLKDLVTVTPSKTGECVRFEVQKSVNGVWHPDTISGCAALNKWSQTMRSSKLSSTGWYRFRPDFTASAKDTTNVSTDGGWLYYVIPS